jgi:hypothetical protein
MACVRTYLIVDPFVTKLLIFVSLPHVTRTVCILLPRHGWEKATPIPCFLIVGLNVSEMIEMAGEVGVPSL